MEATHAERGHDAHTDDVNDDPGEVRARGSQEEAVLEIAETEWSLFHDRSGNPYARLENGQVLRLDQKAAERILRQRFRALYDSTVNSAVLRNCFEELISRALYDAPEQNVWLRVGQANSGETAIDLGDDSYESIKVSGTDVTVGPADCNHLRKPQGGRLPSPAADGDLDLLREFVNVEGEGDFRLVVAWP